MSADDKLYCISEAADALIAAGADDNTIVETNYRKTPQLAATLKPGVAYLWHVDVGYAVKTKDHLLLICDLLTIDKSLEADLGNGLGHGRGTIQKGRLIPQGKGPVPQWHKP